MDDLFFSFSFFFSCESHCSAFFYNGTPTRRWGANPPSAKDFLMFITIVYFFFPLERLIFFSLNVLFLFSMLKLSFNIVVLWAFIFHFLVQAFFCSGDVFFFMCLCFFFFCSFLICAPEGTPQKRVKSDRDRSPPKPELVAGKIRPPR